MRRTTSVQCLFPYHQGSQQQDWMVISVKSISQIQEQWSTLSFPHTQGFPLWLLFDGSDLILLWFTTPVCTCCFLLQFPPNGVFQTTFPLSHFLDADSESPFSLSAVFRFVFFVLPTPTHLQLTC